MTHERSPDSPSANHESTRRTFLRVAVGASTGATLGLIAGCDETRVTSAGADAAGCAAAPDAGSEATAPLLDPSATGMPYRQDDPRWGADLMWDRNLVIRAHHELNGAPLAEARALMREFGDGNNIANEGCLLTSLAMVLQLLAPKAPAWSPRALNELAHASYFYTPCGLSMTTLNADLVSEMTEGAVQLAVKEEYLAGVAGWPKVHAHTSSLVRAYRSLAPAERTNFVVLLKTGTYDDTVASHYLLLHPNDDGTPDDPNPLVLDPAQPQNGAARWRLTDSASAITQDPDIAAGWRAGGIEPTQIGGAWVYVRWRAARDRSELAPLVRAWARELARA
jgi:hypothetical protein